MFSFQLALFLARQYSWQGQQFEGLTRAKYNLDWIESYRDEVVLWIKQNYKEPPRSAANSITLTSFLVIIPVLLARFY